MNKLINKTPFRQRSGHNPHNLLDCLHFLLGCSAKWEHFCRNGNKCEFLSNFIEQRVLDFI